MFPNTTPTISGPTAPTYPSYQAQPLSMGQMAQVAPYGQYQRAIQALQQQQKNMQAQGVGSMVKPPQQPQPQAGGLQGGLMGNAPSGF